MKIMECVSGWGINGAIITCLETTRLLVKRGHQVTLVCRPNAWLAKQFDPNEIDIVYSDMHRWPTDELNRIATIARSSGIDLLHTHMSRANFFGVLLRRFYGIPCVATANNRYIQPHWMFNDHVIAASEATLRFHRRFNLVSKKKIEVIHNFIDASRFLDADDSVRTAIRQKYEFSDSDIVIGQIADVIPRKGLLYLVQALPEILQDFQNTKLLVVGRQDSEYKKTVMKEARRLQVNEAIRWAGAEQDVVPFLRSLDIFALSTLEDNLPLSILEAMACRLPVVASRVGGIPECVTDGKTGLVVRPENPKPLADALKELVGSRSRRESMGAAGRQRVITDFSPESQGPRLEAVFQQVLGRSSRAAA